MAKKRVATTRGMMPLIGKAAGADGPEAILQKAIIKTLEGGGWYTKVLHGNMFQSGLPDLFVAHKSHGQRFIEVKNPLSFSFTQAQLIEFPLITKAGVGIWILFGDTDVEIMKLHKPANWWEIWYKWSNGVKNF